jgi:hypothetical protein
LDEGLELWAAGPVVSFFIADPPPVGLLFVDSPVVVLLAAGPPACELPPALLPPLWAIASDDESANAAASINVLEFMGFLVLKPFGAPQTNSLFSRRFLGAVTAGRCVQK